MGADHSHLANGSELPQAQAQVRQPSQDSVIVMLNQRLDAKAQELRRLEDREVYLAAVINDLETQVVTMTSVIDQVSAENLSLRKSLGLAETGALDLTEGAPQVTPDE